MSENTSTSERILNDYDLDRERLRWIFKKLAGFSWENSQGEPDIDYVRWLEEKLIEANDTEEFRRVKSELMRMVSATCNCTDDVELGSYEGKDQTVLEIPDSVELRYNAPRAPKRETVCIDTCLVPEIKLLWSLGIETTGCCCGHGETEGTIIVAKKDIAKMEALGYEHWQNPMNPDREDCFYTKTSKLH